MLKRLNDWKAKKERDRIKNYNSELRIIESRKRDIEEKIRKKRVVEERGSELKRAREELKQLEGEFKSEKKLFGNIGEKIIEGVKKEAKSFISNYSKPPSKRERRGG